MDAFETQIDGLVGREYKEGFITDIDSETFPPGLNADVIALLSEKMEKKIFI